MIIHFFRDRNLENLDFYQLIDGYFANLANCTMTSDDEVFCATMEMKEFDFKYRFMITKRSRVSSIYRLNSNYKNVNFLCEIPTIIPEYLSRIVLKQVSDICERFNLAIYYEKFDNIREFNMFDLIPFLSKERATYLAEHEGIKSYKVPAKILNDMCIYQSMMSIISDKMKDAVVNKYTVMVEKSTGNVVLSVDWQEGSAMILPPHLDYICIKEDENIVLCLPIEAFLKHADKYCFEVKDDALPFELPYLNQKAALKVKKLVKKMLKTQVSLSNFDTIKITDLIEN